MCKEILKLFSKQTVKGKNLHKHLTLTKNQPNSSRSGKQVRIMSDFRSWCSVDSENMREIIAKIYSRQGGASKMF
jgi:hypothetical protein